MEQTAVAVPVSGVDAPPPVGVPAGAGAAHVSATDAPATVDPAEAVTVAQRDVIAFRLACSGRSVREIGAALGCHHSTASRAVKREAARRAGAASEADSDGHDRQILRGHLLNALRGLWAVSRDPEASPRARVAALRGVGMVATRTARLLGLEGPVRVKHEHGERLEIVSYDPVSGRIDAARVEASPS